MTSPRTGLPPTGLPRARADGGGLVDPARSRPGPGLPLAVALAVIVGCALAGSALGRLPALPPLSDAGFLAGCLVAPLLVRPGDAIRLGLMPALAYSLVALIRAAVTAGGLSGALLQVATVAVAGAPVVLAGTAIALGIGLVRRRVR